MNTVIIGPRLNEEQKILLGKQDIHYFQDDFTK
jgi:hypothetical protein